MKCPYCGGEGVIAGMEDLEQCEMCGGEGEVEDPKILVNNFQKQIIRFKNKPRMAKTVKAAGLEPV